MIPTADQNLYKLVSGLSLFTFAWYNEKSEKTGQEGEYESRIDDIGFLAGYGHI